MPRPGTTLFTLLMTSLIVMDLLFNQNYLPFTLLAFPLTWLIMAGMSVLDRHLQTLGPRQLTVIMVTLLALFGGLLLYGYYLWFVHHMSGIGYQIFFLLYWVKRYGCRTLKIAKARGYHRL